MKRFLLAATATALLLSSAATFAAPAPDKHGRDNDRRSDHREDRREDRRDDRHDGRHDNRYDSRYGDRHDNGRHVGQQRHAWRRGEHLPRAYWGQPYYVNDYRAHRLYAPPRGYRWVQPYRDRNDYVLIQISTGFISRIFGY